MADRTTFTGASTDVPWKNTGMPEGFGDNQARHFKQLYDAAAFPLTSIGGTADDVTATLDPVLDSGGLVDGMKFSLTWDADNTGPMTLALNGGSPADILGADGSVMIAGAAKSGARVLLEYISGAFRIIGGGNSGGAAEPYFTQITASTTWMKPGGYSDDAVVLIEAWGAGGSGSHAVSPAGGGGGAYTAIRLRYVDLPSTLSIVIGAGGASRATSGTGFDGGNTTVGALLTAYGGGGASSSTGGGGGGELSAASGTTAGNPGGGDAAVVARTIWGGGGGSTNPTPSGVSMSVFGGGGGGGRNSGVASLGGLSLHGGRGGNGANNTSAEAGVAPGGGGGGTNSGSTGAGARGEVRIRIFG